MFCLVVVVAMTAATLSACGAGAASPPPSKPTTVAEATVEIAHTTLGNVAYRIFGHGPALVLIMGYAGTMQTWDPHFVDMLALHFRIFIFDNAGIDGTATLPKPLSIDEMADQTSALITTLHLGDVDVLGWSMGTMIAQALAIRHPGQVCRVVLCATYPGVGNAVQPSQKDVNALTGSDPAAAEADLFPSDQTMAADAFDGSLAAYPSSPSTSPSVIAAQKAAILSWFNGHDPSGRRADQISVPTLVADGLRDRIDDATNDREVATEIPGSTLVLYPDAGHTFLFQEGESFLFKVNTFLSGAPTPLTLPQIRQRYLVDYRMVKAAGTKWVAQLKKLSAKSTAQDLASIDLAFADGDGTFDDELLGYGATGDLGASIEAFVSADELIVRDVLAFGVQLGAKAKKWTTTIKNDSQAELAAENVLRHQLGLSLITTTTSTTTTTLSY
jgi:pimeloyl-ACP methyl ester carboxylesterase